MGPGSHPQEGATKPARSRQGWAEGVSAASLSSLLLSQLESLGVQGRLVSMREMGGCLSASPSTDGETKVRTDKGPRTHRPPQEPPTEVISRSKGSGGREPDCPAHRL